jgi:hypothetical protein
MDLDLYLELLHEVKVDSISRITRSSKIKRTTGQLASIEARKRNDPIYKKMMKYRELYLKYRSMLHKKYSPRVKAKARR